MSQLEDDRRKGVNSKGQSDVSVRSFYTLHVCITFPVCIYILLLYRSKNPSLENAIVGRVS